MKGVEVIGPGEGTRFHGIRFEARAVARSSPDLRNVVVRGFQTGLVFSHRSYLVRFYGLRCVSEIEFHFLGGSEDAGELIGFFGGVIEGARIAVLGDDAEFLFDGYSFDFVDQVFVGSGLLTMQACHLEIDRPKAEDSFKVSPQFRFVWLVGTSKPGAEAGVAFQLKGDLEGRVVAMIQSIDGESRTTIGDRWTLDVTLDWTDVRANTGNTHPSAALDGRMPEGYGQVALMLDLSGYQGTLEVRNVFLCAV